MNKDLKTLLYTGIVGMSCCSMADAQSYSNALTGATLIYSNAFSGSGTVSITNTMADYEAGILGGRSNTKGDLCKMRVLEFELQLSPVLAKESR